MKRMILFLLVWFLIGCDLPFRILDNGGEKIPDLGLKTVQDVVWWTAANIIYLKDGMNDTWQSPWVTYERRTGDCDDFSILAIYLIHRDVGKDSKMVVGARVRDGAKHTWVEVDGMWWEPQTGWICESYRFLYEDFKSYSYDDIMGEFAMWFI